MEEPTGIELELTFSRFLHRMGQPVLIDPVFLRKRGAGQVDLCRLRTDDKNTRYLEIFEIKSSFIPANRQIKRLKRSALVLSRLFFATPLLQSFYPIKGEEAGMIEDEEQHRDGPRIIIPWNGRSLIYKRIFLH